MTAAPAVAVVARRWAGRVAGNSDMILLALLALSFSFMHRGDPIGVRVDGLIGGGLLAVQAIAVALVLRSSRIINFAQLAVGQAAGLVFYELNSHSEFVWLAQRVCGGCFPGISSDAAYTQSHPSGFTYSLFAHHFDAWLQINFWLSLVLCIALAAGVSWLIYIVVIARLNSAPRLVATIATIALAGFVTAAAAWLPANLFGDQKNGAISSFYLPFHDVQVKIGDTLFHLGDVFFVPAAVLSLVALAVFLRRSRVGVAVRSASDNPQRAATLGISVNAVTSVVWLLAGALGGVAGVVGQLSSAGGVPGTSTPSLSLNLLTEVLAVLVFARLTSLPRVVLASLLLGMVGTGLAWNFNVSQLFDGLVFLLIGAALLLQRHRASRADDEAGTNFLSAREARPIPHELRDLPVVQGWLRALGFVLAALVFGLPFVLDPSQVTLGVDVVLFAIVGLSLLVLTGWAGQISLGQWAFAAIGAFAAAWLAGRGLPMLLCIVGGALTGAAVATLVGIPGLRLRGMYLAVTTIAFATATSALVTNSNYGGRLLPATLSRPVLLGLDLNDERVYFFFALVLLVLCVAAVAGMRRSRIARALIACRDNEGAAQSFGIDLVRARLAAFAISGFLAALAGAAFAFHEGAVLSPSYLPDQSVTVFLMVVIGGLGSIAGPLVGAAYQGVLTLFNDPVVSLLGSGAGVLVVLLLFPGGLVAAALRVRDNMLRRVAARNRIVVPSLTAGLLKEGEEDRVPISALTQARGVHAFVPTRYRLVGQWKELKEARRG